jgi:hypothetical protein
MGKARIGKSLFVQRFHERVADTDTALRRIGARTVWTAWLVLIAPIACSCTSVNVAPENPETRTRLQVIRSVVVIAPDVQLVRRVIGGTEEPLHDEDALAATNLAALVGNELSSHGFQTKQSLAADKAPNSIQSVYDQISYEEKYELEHPTLRSLSNLGSAAASLGKQTGSDAIVFVKFTGYKRLGGSIAGEAAKATLVTITTMGIYTPPKDPNTAAELAVMMVDSKTGDVLWSNMASEVWIITMPDFGPSDLEKMVTKVFANFPQ